MPCITDAPTTTTTTAGPPSAVPPDRTGLRPTDTVAGGAAE